MQDNTRELLSIQGFVPGEILFDKEKSKILIKLTRTEQVYKCSECGQEYTSFYDSRMHIARDLAYGCWFDSWIEFERVRVDCSKCGVKVESLDWIDTQRHYTKRLAEEVARECRLIQSIVQVAQRFRLGWDTVKEIDKEYLTAELNPPDFTRVEYLAMDELSIKKRHRYATAIVDPIRKRVLWVVKDRTIESVKEFFEMFGSENCKKIRAAAMDMWPAYEAAVRKYCPQAEIVYDQFHIVRDYGMVISSVRSQEAQKASKRDKEIFAGTKYLLLANHGRYRKQEERSHLQELLSLNRKISTVYILKDELKELWRFTYEGAARRWFEGWYRKAIYSRIAPLKEFARSLKRHIHGILAHCRHKLHTSFLEGMINKIKVIKRVAFGFRDQEYFFLKIRGAFTS